MQLAFTNKPVLNLKLAAVQERETDINTWQCNSHAELSFMLLEYDISYQSTLHISAKHDTEPGY